jgi:dienelactone hydrolase
MSNERRISHEFRSEQLESVLVTTGSAKATVIQFPTVMGVTDLEIGFARTLAAKGYNSFVADLFGKEFHGAPRDVMFGEMNRLRADRAALRDRLLSVLDVAEQQEEVDRSRIAAIGFCFGGQCALDLARSGVDIAGVASFHGLFDPPGLEPNPIKAHVIAFHGWDDPMVPPEKVVALGQELTAAGCDWQIHAYGHVGHGFTNPHASELQIPGVQYNKLANDRSWYALDGFLGELFG